MKLQNNFKWMIWFSMFIHVWTRRFKNCNKQWTKQQWCPKCNIEDKHDEKCNDNEREISFVHWKMYNGNDRKKMMMKCNWNMFNGSEEKKILKWKNEIKRKNNWHCDDSGTFTNCMATTVTGICTDVRVNDFFHFWSFSSMDFCRPPPQPAKMRKFPSILKRRNG